MAGILEKVCTWVKYYFKAKINENEVNRAFGYRVVLYLFVKIRERNVISSFYSTVMYPIHENNCCFYYNI